MGAFGTCKTVYLANKALRALFSSFSAKIHQFWPKISHFRPKSVILAENGPYGPFKKPGFGQSSKPGFGQGPKPGFLPKYRVLDQVQNPVFVGLLWVPDTVPRGPFGTPVHRVLVRTTCPPPPKAVVGTSGDVRSIQLPNAAKAALCAGWPQSLTFLTHFIDFLTFLSKPSSCASYDVRNVRKWPFSAIFCTFLTFLVQILEQGLLTRTRNVDFDHFLTKTVTFCTFQGFSCQKITSFRPKIDQN